MSELITDTLRPHEDAALEELLVHAARLASGYRSEVGQRPVRARSQRQDVRAALDGGLPDVPSTAGAVIQELVAAADAGITGSVGPRFFGFVIGGALPVATAADFVTSGWDQCAYNEALSPAAAAAEDVAGSWLKELLGLPATASVGFVTGAQAANTVGLAAARHHVLTRAGWDVERDGLAGAPRVRVVASSERHATIDRALRLLGFGTAIVEAVATDPNGAIDPASLAAVLADGPAGPVIVCLQAGNVNTGAIDNFRTTIPLARKHDAWVHVDGAFGLWAAASPATAAMLDGVDVADSWGCDAHKWLNVGYDSGLAICAHPDVHASAVSYAAAYLTGSGRTADYTLGDLTPESSRRARGFAVWAVLKQLGRSGVAEMIETSCALARRMAEHLNNGGATIYNDVVLNQVLVGFGDGVDVDALVEAVQGEGTCWVGATTWRGRRLMRVSISNWTTTPEDIDRSAGAILRLATAT
jgi:glutamate/tyrosine decarboxylase-like PLP-dependent enzyme